MNEVQPDSQGTQPSTGTNNEPQAQSNDSIPTTSQETPDSSSILTTTTKTATITASFVVPAVAKPLPTPALPFQSARASESLYTSNYASSSFGRTPARSGAAAAASAAALQLQRELDLQHEVLGRKPQLAQDIVPKEPANPPTFRDYGATRDWRREQSRDRRDRSRERERERERDRHSRSRYDRSRDRDRGRHRERYSRERSQDRDYDRDRDYRHDRGYRDYRYGEHSSDRDYRGYRHDRHDRHYRDKEHDRPSHREYDYEEGGRVSGRYDSLEPERERSQWKEGDEDGDTLSTKGQDQRDYDYERERGRGRDRESDRDRYRHWDRSRGYDHDDKYGPSHDWDDRNRAPRDREQDRDRDMDIDKPSSIDDQGPYRSASHHSRDQSVSGYSSGTRPHVDDETRIPLGNERATATSTEGTALAPNVDPTLTELQKSISAVSAPPVAPSIIDQSTPDSAAVRPSGDSVALSEPVSQTSKLPYEPPVGTTPIVSDPASISRPPPPPPPPLPPVPPGATTAQAPSVAPAAFSANGHPPPPPPLHPPVAPHGYTSQGAPPTVPVAPAAESVYPHPSGNAPPPPRRSTADDEYYGSHSSYYRHSRSSHYRDSWHGAEGDHRYDRRSHSRWPGHYSSDYDRHSRAPSPRNRGDRYDYGYQENGAPRVASAETVYPPGVHQEVHALHPDMRRTPPPLEIQVPQYVGPYPAIDPTLQHMPVPPTPPILKGEDLYERVGQVGEGTYGKVYKARNKQTGEYVALKRIRMETEKDGFPITAMREIKLLQSLNHRHVISLKELMVSKGAVYMVFEYMDHDLTGILAHPQLKFRPEHVKCLMKQLLEGLGFLHHKGVLHRDIKGSNLLVNNQGELKLADFGLARLFQKKTKRDYTNRVITLWYRPPELILGATAYGPEVDMWSAGCIMVELFTRKPIFQGHNEISQLDNIWKTMGTPQKETWPNINQLPWYELIKHVTSEARPSRFREVFGKIMSPAALELAETLLSLNPELRPTANEALTKFAYFTEEEPAACTPEELPKIEGDWHEYESKQRKKATAKPKQHSHHPRHPSEGDRSDHPEHAKPNDAGRQSSSRKHGLGGDLKPVANTPTVPPPASALMPVGLVVMSGSGNTEPTPAVIEQTPEILTAQPPKAVEPIIPPPAVSPSYLPYSLAPSSQPTIVRHAPETVAPDYCTVPPQTLGQPPPPPPPAPVHPMYSEHLLTDQTIKPYVQDPSLIHEAANGGPIANRYPDQPQPQPQPGVFDQSRLGPMPPQAATAPIAPVAGDVYMLDAHRGAYGSDEHHRGSIQAPHADHSKGYHDGHDRSYDYYSRRHYDYGRDRDRDRDRDRYRDYSRRRSDYRVRDWSRDRDRDRGGRDRDRDRDRDYDRYRDRSGRDYDRGRDRDRERSYDEDDHYYRERGRERDGDRDYADFRGRDRDRERDRERDRDREREHGIPRDDERELDRSRNADRDRELDIDGRLEGHSLHGRRRERSAGEYDDDYERDRESDKEEHVQRQNLAPAPKKLKISTDSSSLSPPSTTTSLSSMT